MLKLRCIALIFFLSTLKNANSFGSQASPNPSVPVVFLESASQSVRSISSKPLGSLSKEQAQKKLLALSEQKKHETNVKKFRKQTVPQIVLAQLSKQKKDASDISSGERIIAKPTHTKSLTPQEMTMIFGRNKTPQKRDYLIAQLLGKHSVLPMDLIKIIIDYGQFYFAGKCEHTFQAGYGDGLNTLVFTSDDILACGSSANKIIELWDVNGGKQLGYFNCHAHGINALIPASGGTLISGDSRGKIKIWRLSRDRKRTAQQILEISAHTAEVSALATIPDQEGQPQGRIVSGAEDSSIKIWNSQTGECLHILQERNPAYRWHFLEIRDLAIQYDHHNKPYIVSHANEAAWDPVTGQKHIVGQRYSSIALTEQRNPSSPKLPNGNLVLHSDDDNLIKIWNPKKECFENQLRGHKGTIENFAVSTTGVVASIDSDKTIKIWS